MPAKISIVVPTRERAEYVGHAVATCLAAEDPDIEVVVSDNASGDGTREVIARIDDPRVRYVNTGARVSMRANFEFAVAHSTGDYVLAIGDDDGVLPAGIAALRRLVEEQAPDLVNWEPVSFEWPDGGSMNGRGHVQLKPAMVFGHAEIHPTAPLADAAWAGRLRKYRDCPGIYHACASRRLVEAFRERSGAYFRGQIPDVYFCYSAVLNAPDYVLMGHPVTIGGASAKSNGAATNPKSRGPERDRLRDLFHEEARIDGDPEPIDMRVRSLNANQLSSLIVADRVWGGGGRRIDFERWCGRIVADFRLLPADERAWSVETVRENLAELGQADAFETAMAGAPFPDVAPVVARRRKVSTPTRLILTFDERATVLDAALRLDRLLAGHDPLKASAGAKIVGWTRTLARAATAR